MCICISQVRTHAGKYGILVDISAAPHLHVRAWCVRSWLAPEKRNSIYLFGGYGISRSGRTVGMEWTWQNVRLWGFSYAQHKVTRCIPTRIFHLGDGPFFLYVVMLERINGPQEVVRIRMETTGSECTDLVACPLATCLVSDMHPGCHVCMRWRNRRGDHPDSPFHMCVTERDLPSVCFRRR